MKLVLLLLTVTGAFACHARTAAATSRRGHGPSAEFACVSANKQGIAVIVR